MSTPAIDIPQPLVVTESAARRVYELLKEEGDFSLKLRVYIEGGGCSGFQYGFTFDDVTQADDMVVSKTIKLEGESGGAGSMEIQMLVDAMSYQYLVGAEIDYESDLQGERFIIRNPQAETTCGCGSSFSMKD